MFVLSVDSGADISGKKKSGIEVNIEPTTIQSESRQQGHICASFCPISLSDEPFLPYGFQHPWTDCVSNSARSSPRSLFNLHLLWPFFFFSSFRSLASPPFTPLTTRLVSALNGFRGSPPSPFPVLIALVRSELRERIKEGFEPSSLCSYYPLSSDIAAPAHPTPLLCYSPSPPLSISKAIIFLHPFCCSTPSHIHLYTSLFPSISFLSSRLLSSCLIWPWRNVVAMIRKWNTALKKLFKDTIRNNFCDTFVTSFVKHTHIAHTGSEELPYTDNRWYDRRKPSGECDRSEEARSLCCLKDDWGEGGFVFVELACLCVCELCVWRCFYLCEFVIFEVRTCLQREDILSGLHFSKRMSYFHGFVHNFSVMITL